MYKHAQSMLLSSLILTFINFCRVCNGACEVSMISCCSSALGPFHLLPWGTKAPTVLLTQTLTHLKPLPDLPCTRTHTHTLQSFSSVTITGEAGGSYINELWPRYKMATMCLDKPSLGINQTKVITCVTSSPRMFLILDLSSSLKMTFKI